MASASPARGSTGQGSCVETCSRCSFSASPWGFTEAHASVAACVRTIITVTSSVHKAIQLNSWILCTNNSEFSLLMTVLYDNAETHACDVTGTSDTQRVLCSCRCPGLG